MAEEAHNITNDLLRALRADVAKIIDTQNDHTKRFSQVERQLAGVRGDIATIHELIVDHGDDIRSLKARVERLEQHAGLSDAFKQ